MVVAWQQNMYYLRMIIIWRRILGRDFVVGNKNLEKICL